MLSFILQYNIILLIFNDLTQKCNKNIKKHLTSQYFVLYICNRKSRRLNP